jgi:HlyD family secretion protein
MIAMTRPSFVHITGIVGLVALSGACRSDGELGPHRATGYVEATEVRIASKVPGRVDRVEVTEGEPVAAGDLLISLSTTETDLALDRAAAERAQAVAQERLLAAGARPEDIRQAEAQVAAASADLAAVEAELEAARRDETRFTQLLERRAGSVKQYDDAASRRQLAEARARAAAERVAAATATLERLRAGARSEEIEAARARIAAIDAEMAALLARRTDATIVAPMSGVAVSRLVEPGELVAVGVPLAVLMDLDRAWVNAYVEEPLVPTLRLDQAAIVVTDAGDEIAGQVAFIAPRAEFTPRNVQTASERAKLVYRVKITVDNTEGILKPGMPVDVLLESVAGEP